MTLSVSNGLLGGKSRWKKGSVLTKLSFFLLLVTFGSGRFICKNLKRIFMTLYSALSTFLLGMILLLLTSLVFLYVKSRYSCFGYTFSYLMVHSIDSLKVFSLWMPSTIILSPLLQLQFLFLWVPIWLQWHGNFKWVKRRWIERKLGCYKLWVLTHSAKPSS